MFKKMLTSLVAIAAIFASTAQLLNSTKTQGESIAHEHSNGGTGA